MSVSKHSSDECVNHIYVRVTPQILMRVKQLLAPEDNRLSLAEKADLRKDFEKSGDGDNQRTLSYESIRLICRHSLLSLKDVLKDGGIITPPPQEVMHTMKPSDELRCRREYLLRRQEERKYNIMMYGSSTHPIVSNGQGQHEQSSSSLGIGSALNQASIATNMVVSSLACFVVAYFIGQQLGASSTAFLTWGLLSSIAMLLLEMVLYLLREMRTEERSQAKKVKQNFKESRKGQTADTTRKTKATMIDSQKELDQEYSEKEVRDKKKQD